MENTGEMRTDQQQKIPSVLGFQAYPGPSNLFQFNPNISSTRNESSNVCSNSQFQNIPPFGSAYQAINNVVQPSFSTVPNAQNSPFIAQNTPQTSSQLPQFAASNSPFETSFNFIPNTTPFSSKSTLFSPDIPFNLPSNVPQFNPTKVAGNFLFGPSRCDDDVVQFPFGDFGYRNRQIRGKRRTDLDELENVNLPPTKQHITEEKMAEHMSRLHINSETPPSIIEPESVKNKRLYMCEEMRKLQTDPILPTCLLRQKPCTALVLWQPPAKVLNIPNSSANNNNNIDDDESAVNNNENRLVNRNVMNDIEFEQNVVNTMEMDV